MERPDGGGRDDERAGSDPNGSGPNDGATAPDGVTDRDGATERAEEGPIVRSDATGESADSGSDGGGSNEDGSDDASAATIEDDGVVRWFLGADGTAAFVRDVITSVALVAAVALVLFAVSGIWPPLVAVESGSMEPNMERGDLIFVVDEERFVGDDPVAGTGVVTRDVGAENGHQKFGEPGDVIIFTPNGNERATPVIHRAHFWVEEGDNWVAEKAESEYVGSRTCLEIRSCPAEHDGFVTKGDANRGYDQAGMGAQTTIIKPEWIEGKATFRIPYLGYVRLTVDSLLWTGGGAPFGSGVPSGSALPNASGAVVGASVAMSGLAGGATLAIGRRT